MHCEKRQERYNRTSLWLVKGNKRGTLQVGVSHNVQEQTKTGPLSSANHGKDEGASRHRRRTRWFVRNSERELGWIAAGLEGGESTGMGWRINGKFSNDIGGMVDDCMDRSGGMED